MATLQNCASCERVSENKRFECPPRMADGRLFTDYRPRCDINYDVDGLNKGGPLALGMDSYAYRQFLIANAAKLMTSQRSAAYHVASCGPCKEPYNVGTMLPEQSVVKCDKQSCKVSGKDPRGLGTGRDYGTWGDSASTQAEFLKYKQSEQASKKACCGGDVPLGMFAS